MTAEIEKLIVEASVMSEMMRQGRLIATGKDARMVDRLIAALQHLLEANNAMQAEKREMALDVLAASGQAQEAYEAQLAAEAKVARLEASYWKMRSYATHDDGCKLNKPPRFSGPCSCGLFAAMHDFLETKAQEGTPAG